MIFPVLCSFYELQCHLLQQCSRHMNCIILHSRLGKYQSTVCYQTFGRWPTTNRAQAIMMASSESAGPFRASTSKSDTINNKWAPYLQPKPILTRFRSQATTNQAMHLPPDNLEFIRAGYGAVGLRSFARRRCVFLWTLFTPTWHSSSFFSRITNNTI